MKNVKVISAYALQVITMIFLNLYEMLFLHQCDINGTSTKFNIIEMLQI
jgi:hypothetical protein